MSDVEKLFDILRQHAAPEVVDAMVNEIASAPDYRLFRINPFAFAEHNKLDAERTISSFLHASKIGLFDIAWNVLCPGCGGVLDTNASLKSIRKDEYVCSLCAEGYAPTLDEMVEVTFTVNARVRRIAAHSPEQLPVLEYYRQLYWGSSVDLPEPGYEDLIDQFLIEHVEAAAGERAVLSVTLPSAFVIVFEPVTHAVQFIDVKGEPTRERQLLSIAYDREHVHNETLEMRPGPLRLSVENRTSDRVLPSIFIAGEALHGMLAKRRSFLSAKKLLTNQTFRNLFRTETLDVDQRLKITSLTFLFTDLRGSTELYERVGDLAAFDLVRSHFQRLDEVVASEAGAVVKTIGDAVMATFPTPDRAMTAALKMREEMRAMRTTPDGGEFLLKIGLHEGPCIAVMMNERQDYFGQTINIASRVQGLANSQSIFVTDAIVSDAKTLEVLRQRSLQAQPHDVLLKGIGRNVKVFEIP
ncbi:MULTISPECIES: adenylate/guanylate cyclase domain-containing protein [Mesorhizobium]|uniref:Adenylate/guanylate cyclase domain-containing protein n=1 Tax=Mesorhizobium denitrificans TaxID=2294114 RepID=A0A371XFZ7_9HYPH|nr:MULTISPECIES: adenylate/guanylate cyclase domain-containing protein [Mesorhizobium]RFC68149.1 adenylate/guanylate cyclase domain-containing protein [Mesorhizobium denitrificans]